MLVSKGSLQAIEQGLLLDLVEGLFSPGQSMCCPAARLNPQTLMKNQPSKNKKKRSKMSPRDLGGMTTKLGLIKTVHLGLHPN